MSFFQQSQRKLAFNIQKFKTPSPFQYNTQGLSKSVFAKAPFGSTTKLNRSTSSCLLNEKKNNSIIQNDNILAFNDLKSSVIKKQQQKSSAFKSQTERFKQKEQIAPGPAQYEIKPLFKTISQKKCKYKSYSTHNFLANKYNQHLKVPSIPSDHLGYKQGKSNVMQKVVPSLNLQPELGIYELREELIKKNGLKWKNTKKNIYKNQQMTPGPGDYQIKMLQNKKAPVSSFKSTKERFNVHDSKKQKRPGPGYYNPDNITKKQDFKIKNQSHFSSKTSRFNWMNPSTNIGPGQYLNLDKNKSKSMTQFRKSNENQSLPLQNSKPVKKTIFYQNNLNPGPGQYANTLGMGFKLQKQLLRKYTDSVFPKQKRETFQLKKQTLPGPGTYNFNQNQKNSQKKTNNGLYKKIQVINLKNEKDEINPSPFDYANFNNTIEHKANQTHNKLTLTQCKPFGHGQQRFKHYLLSSNQRQNIVKIKQNQNQFSNKKVKKIVMTNIKVNIPFGSSAQKIPQKVQQKHTTSDFYIPKEDWVKKSHNIKSKLKIAND